MASKKIHFIDDFSKGMNDNSSPRKIDTGQISYAQEVQFSEHGKIVPMGRSKNYYSDDSNFSSVNREVTPGYGLGHFNSGYSMAGSGTSSISTAITTQATPGEYAYTILDINEIAWNHTLTGLSHQGQQAFFQDVSEAMANNNGVKPFTFTMALSGGESLGSISYDRGSLVSAEDTSSNSSWDWKHAIYQNDYLGLFGEINPPNTGSDTSPTGGAASLATLLAAEINTTSSNVQAYGNYPSRGMVSVWAEDVGTTLNGQFVNLTITNNAGTTPFTTNNNNASAAFEGHLEHTWNNVSNTPVEFPVSGSLAGGAAATTHVVTLTIDSVDASTATDFMVKIGCIEGSTHTERTVKTTISAGTSTADAAEAIKDAILADSDIKIADNIAGAGATNSDFAVRVGNTVVLTSDVAGNFGFFTCGAWVNVVVPNNADDEYVALMANDGFLNVLSKNVGTWIGSANFLGTSGNDSAIWSNANPKTQYYAMNGALRMYDIDLSHTANNNKVLLPVNQTGLFNGTGGATLSIQKWVLVDQDVDWAYTFESNSKGLRTAADSSVAASPANKKMEIKIETDGNANQEPAEGMWGGAGAEKFAFFASAVYYDGSETLPDHQFTFNSGSDKYLSFDYQRLKITVHANPGAIDTEANYIAGLRVKAFNIYWSTEKDGYGEKNLLCTIDFKDGLIREDGGSTLGWIQSSGAGVKVSDGTNAYAIIDNPVEINTFQTRNFYDYKGQTLKAKYKTATVAGRRAFIGHVLVDGVEYNDRIIYSPLNQFDVFPHPDNILQTTSSDGSNITALANTGDRLFEFKQNRLYIHNISSGDPSTFYLEATLPFYGVEGENQVVNTPGGLFWCNNISAYYYDGDPANIKDLRYYESDDKEIKRISDSTWSTYYSADSAVGYDGNSNTIILKEGTTGDDGCGKIMQYDIANDAWAVGSKYKYSNTADASNFINLNNGSLINAVSAQSGNGNIPTIIEPQAGDSAV